MGVREGVLTQECFTAREAESHNKIKTKTRRDRSSIIKIKLNSVLHINRRGAKTNRSD